MEPQGLLPGAWRWPPAFEAGQGRRRWKLFAGIPGRRSSRAGDCRYNTRIPQKIGKPLRINPAGDRAPLLLLRVLDGGEVKAVAVSEAPSGDIDISSGVEGHGRSIIVAITAD